MLEIKGNINTAICYTKVIETEAIEQIQRMCDYEFTKGSKIRIMPDVHAGKGCTIGTTMTVHDKVVPNIVGVDIGCGMYTIDLGYEDIDFEKFDLTNLRCYRYLKDTKRLERNLGKQVADYYQGLAIELGKGKEEYFAKRDALIEEYKAAGRHKEIQNALKQL